MLFRRAVDRVDLYALVHMCDQHSQWKLSLIDAVCTRGTFFNITKDTLEQNLLDSGVVVEWDRLREEYLETQYLPFFYHPGNADEATAYAERLKTLKRVVAEGFHEADAGAWFADVLVAKDADELDRLLKIGQENKMLKSYLWAFASTAFANGFKDSFLASEHFSEALIKYEVPLHPHLLPCPLEPDTSDLRSEEVWSCHFASMHNHVVRVRQMIKMKHAFAKLYYRCFASAFQDPLGKARLRENETAAADFEEAVAKRMRCE